LHKAAISNLTVKQQAKLKSPIKDVNERLNSVHKCFDPLNPLFSPGSRIVNHFPGRISFHSPLSSSDDNLFSHIQNLNNTFSSSQNSHNSIAVITDGGIKKSYIATVVAHIWSEYSVVKQLQIQAVNVTPIEVELMAIHISLIPAIEDNNIHDITVITDSISAASKVLESKVNPFQNMVIPVAYAIKLYLARDGRNRIHFWYCSSKGKWPRHKLVDDLSQTSFGHISTNFSTIPTVLKPD